jgi:hypothetical protein
LLWRITTEYRPATTAVEYRPQYHYPGPRSSIDKESFQNVDATLGKKVVNKPFARFLYELERPKAWISIYNTI